MIEIVDWANTAEELARVWFPSMRYRSRVKIEQDDIRDFLIDFWLLKNGQGEEFEEGNRGRLYNYSLANLGRSRDMLAHASSLSDIRPAGQGEDEAFDEDRLGFLSYSEDEDADIDPDLREELCARLEELAGLGDTGLSGALAEIFGMTDRRGRSFSAEVRQEKIPALVFDAAKAGGMEQDEVKKLAAEIAQERRRSIARINAGGGDFSYAEIEAFEEMMGLAQTVPPTAKPAKTRSRSGKAKSAKTRRKSMVQLGLVEQPRLPSSSAGSQACRPQEPAR